MLTRQRQLFVLLLGIMIIATLVTQNLQVVRYIRINGVITSLCSILPNGPSIFKSQRMKITNVSTKWVVVTSINHPTEDVKRLASLPDWKVVVVADTKTPKNWSWPGVHFLSVEKQLSLGLSLPNILPFKTYTRKNVGYLYAIMNGAEWIYDTDDDNKPYGRGLDQFDYGQTVSGLRYTPRGNISEKLFNPYRFFGYKDMWPRGFPLEYLSDHTNGEDRMISCREMKTAAVQQGIVHKDPDVDGIYRLLHADRNSGLNVTFNKFAPPILLEAGTYSPWNSQNTLFHSRAFYTMFLPTTVEFRVTDIWRSYFAQKMLHLTGESIAFYPVNAVQFRNAHNYLADFEDEIAVYTKSGKIVKYLDEFQCTSLKTKDCFMELARGFTKQDFIQSAELDLIEAWLSDLTAIGYRFPPLSPPENQKVNLTEFRGNCRSSNTELKVLDENVETNNTSHSLQKINYFNDILTWCIGNKTYTPNIPSAEVVEIHHSAMQALEEKKDTVAVFINNYPWTHSIGFLQRMYAPYFAAMVFCGSWNPESFVEDELPIIHPINYVNLTEEEAEKGFIFYYCVAKVRDLRLQNVKGYYFIADDAVFNFWHQLPMNSTLKSKYSYPDKLFWDRIVIGEDAAKMFVNLMEGKYANNPKVQLMWKEYDRRVKLNGFKSGKETMLTLTGRTITDFFYVPLTDFDFYSDMCEYLAETKLFLELATHKILHAINATVIDKYDYTYGVQPKVQLKNYYKASSYGLHPVKLSYANNDTEHRQLFCSTVVSAFYENLFKFD